MATAFVWFGYHDATLAATKLAEATSTSLKDDQKNAALEVLTLLAKHGAIMRTASVPPNPVNHRVASLGALQKISSHPPVTPSGKSEYSCLISDVYDTEADADGFIGSKTGLADLFTKECIVYSKLEIVIQK